MDIETQFPILLDGLNMARPRKTLYFAKIKVISSQTLTAKKESGI